MIKKTFLGIVALAFVTFMGISAFSPAPPPSVADCGCPPGWVEHQFGPNSNNPNLVKDKNGDRIMCYKDLPQKANGNGNNLGNAPSRNWKDNKICD